MSSAVARNNIREAVKSGLLSITTGGGYRNNIYGVFDPPRDVSQITDFPSVNVLWGEEERTTYNEYGGQIAGNRPLMNLKWSCDLDVFIVNENDPQSIGDSIVADIGEYFGKNFYVPDSGGDRTAFIAIYRGSSPVMGTELQRPNAWMTVLLDVWYRVPWDNYSVLA